MDTFFIISDADGGTDVPAALSAKSETGRLPASSIVEVVETVSKPFSITYSVTPTKQCKADSNMIDSNMYITVLFTECEVTIFFLIFSTDGGMKQRR